MIERRLDDKPARKAERKTTHQKDDSTHFPLGAQIDHELLGAGLVVSRAPRGLQTSIRESRNVFLVMVRTTRVDGQDGAEREAVARLHGRDKSGPAFVDIDRAHI